MINYIKIVYDACGCGIQEYRVGINGVRYIECVETKVFNRVDVKIKDANKTATYSFNKRKIAYICIEEPNEGKQQDGEVSIC